MIDATQEVDLCLSLLVLVKWLETIAIKIMFILQFNRIEVLSAQIGMVASMSQPSWVNALDSSSASSSAASTSKNSSER